MPLQVLGVVIIRDGRVLVAHRADHPAESGWEFPGGKREPGESLAQTAVREIREELGVSVTVGVPVPGPPQPIDDRLELVLVTATTDDPVDTSTDHDELRWLAPDDLHSVPWLAPDLPFLPEVARLARGTVTTGQPEVPAQAGQTSR